MDSMTLSRGGLVVGAVLAVLLSSWTTNPVRASVVTFDMTVDDGTSPVTINLGETVTVKLYATVTDNEYSSVDLGLAGYGLDILTTDGYLDPVEGWDGFDWDQEWDVTWAIPALSIRARGNTDNVGNDDDVLGHGAALAELTLENRDIAVTRTLLASGEFKGVALGTTTVSFGASPSANVVWYDGGYVAVAADTINTEGGAQVTVVPEPGTAVLLAFGFVTALRRRRRSLGRPGRHQG